MAASELIVVTTGRTDADFLDIAGEAEPANVDGNYFANTGRQMVAVINASGGPITVTQIIQETLDGAAVNPQTASIPDGVTAILGSYDTGVYNDDDGFVQLEYSDVTSVSVVAFEPLTTSEP